MARKPKPAPPVEASATIAEPELPMLGKAPAPVRRGRPPKPAETPPRSSAAEDDGVAAADVAEDDMAADTEADAPSKRRQGRKPEPSGGAAAPLSRDEPRRAMWKRGRKPGDAEPAAESEGAALSAKAVDEDGPTAGSDANARGAAGAKPADEAAPSSVVSEPTASSRPAAHWDRATGTVQFDWPEIERTAAQDGPDQAMAKLLVAARAEGAHSRWPF